MDFMDVMQLMINRLSIYMNGVSNMHSCAEQNETFSYNNK